MIRPNKTAAPDGGRWIEVLRRIGAAAAGEAPSVRRTFTMLSKARVLLVLALVGVSYACAGKMARVQRALDGYQAALRLSVRPTVEDLVIGEAPGVSLTIENVSSASVSACIGVSRDYMVLTVPIQSREGRQPAAGQSRMIDHPYCVRRLDLAPGERSTWHEEWAVPDIGVGEARLLVSVQIVHPRDCERVDGCYDTMLKAEARGLQFRRSR